MNVDKYQKLSCGLKASSIYLHSSSSICSSDVYRQQSGWCCYLASILTHFLTLNLSRFSFYINIDYFQGFKVAYVVFEEIKGLENALKLNKKIEPLILSTKETPIDCGLKSKYFCTLLIFEVLFLCDHYFRGLLTSFSNSFS